jgi:hypothetical protein
MRRPPKKINQIKGSVIHMNKIGIPIQKRRGID